MESTKTVYQILENDDIQLFVFFFLNNSYTSDEEYGVLEPLGSVLGLKRISHKFKTLVLVKYEHKSTNLFT